MMKAFWRSTWMRVAALEAVVIAVGTVLVLASARVVNARGIALHLASLLQLP